MLGKIWLYAKLSLKAPPAKISIQDRVFHYVSTKSHLPESVDSDPLFATKYLVAGYYSDDT